MGNSPLRGRTGLEDALGILANVAGKGDRRAACRETDVLELVGVDWARGRWGGAMSLEGTRRRRE